MSSAISNTSSNLSQAEIMRLLEEEKKNAAQGSDKKGTNSNKGGYTNETQQSTGLEQLNMLMQNAAKALGLRGTDQMTYGKLQEYREKLENEFSLKTQVGLLAAGVSKEAEFRLISGKDGGIEVVSDNPEEKAKIEKFFKENPDMVKQFQEIQSLKGMKEKRDSNTPVNMSSIRSQIQMEAMGWWAEGGNSASLMMGDKGGSTSFMSGINVTV